MVQGTASAVGKSLICTALCRILRDDGISVAPFKAQNMALNSFVTADGLEMGRAQVTQAEAAGIEPRVEMNPVLLKPTSDQDSQVVVMGRPVGNMGASAYQHWKENLLDLIDNAFMELSGRYDVVIIEGAGSPAEINLRDRDLVNMGLALRLQAPVVLVGDIDRGGVFASIYGTVALLRPRERLLLKGVIINKFRGDPLVLEPGLKELEELIGQAVLGVVPYAAVNIDDEDSLADRFRKSSAGTGLTIKVIHLPRMANFTDFNPLELDDDVSLSYIRSPGELGDPDLLILPGSKNTIDDLLSLRRAGWQEVLDDYVGRGGLLIGICGGYQMLGKSVMDPRGLESAEGEAAGFGFLDLETVLEAGKTTRQVEAAWRYRDNAFFALMTGNESLKGYEIHMGRTLNRPARQPLYLQGEERWDGAVSAGGNVFGTYLHGIFDNLDWTGRLLNALRTRRGLPLKNKSPFSTYRHYKDEQYGRLAALVRHNLDIKEIYRIIAAAPQKR